MIFVIYCIDKPDSQSVRLLHRPAHVTYMMSFQDKIVLLGPLLPAEGTEMIGSLIVIDLPNRTAVESLIANDPYNLAGLFLRVEIHLLKRVL